MPRLVVRERLLADLRQRHQRKVIALESPAGYGRSVLLGQALVECPERSTDRDVFYRCGPDDARPGQLAKGLLEACGGRSGTDADQLESADQAAGLVAGALESLAVSGTQVALVIDNVEHSGAAGATLLPALLHRLSDHCHLVLSGRRLPRMGLAREVAAGTGLLVDVTDLAFRPDELSELGESHAELTLTDVELASWPALASLVLQGRPDLVSGYLVESVLHDADPVVARALAAVAAVGGCETELLTPVVGAVTDLGQPSEDGNRLLARAATLDGVLTELGLFPLVQTREGCWPHPVWADATRSLLTTAERHQATVAKARGQVAVGAISDAGRLALRTRNAEAMTVAVRSALASLPPNASVADLKSWAESELLPPGSPEHDWLVGVVDLQLGGAAGTGSKWLEQSRQAFELAKDEEGETGVLLHLGAVARSRGDRAELGRLLERAGVLAEQGNPVAQGLVALGQAIAAQLVGDPEAAIRALDRVPPGSLVGEWGAQLLMIRGTNLLLAGQSQAAMASLVAATGEGSDSSRAIAHDLLATARWYADDPIGAMADEESAETLALRAGTPSFIQLVRAAKACLLAAAGRSAGAREVLEQIHQAAPGAASDEATALARLAEVLLLVDGGDLDGARGLLEETSTVERAVRSSVWKVALETALLPTDLVAPTDATRQVVALNRAVAAGRAAARHLGGGSPASQQHRPYLPWRWCTPSRPSIVVSLNGAGLVERDFRPVDHPAWGRARVRELCLHLALVEDRTRTAVAAALWPDRGDRSAGLNLRVTLTHLLDVLDPERVAAKGSDLIVDSGGSLRFSRDRGLHIDLWDIERHAKAILATPAHERPSLLAHARRLIEIVPGPLLGGVAVGEWFDPYRRTLDDLVVTASLHAGFHALGAADHGLAQALGRRALEADSWSERAHALVIEARLDGGDVDGARRALLHALSVLQDLDVAPGHAIVELGYRAGLNHQSISSGRREV
jgi:DNA-binding SARP family transcriptional activator